MASLLDLADARLRGLLDSRKVERPSMTGLLGGTQPQGTLAGAIQGFTPTPMQAMSNQAVMGYARNVASTARQNMAQQMSDLDRALVMDQGGINIGDRQALARLMEQVPGLMGATAYHGSPYRFDKFDLSKQGTGAGNQLYGKGMYFAESPSVASQYMGNLGEYKITVDGNVVDTPVAQAIVRYQGDPNAFINSLQNKIKDQKNALKKASKEEVLPGISEYDMAKMDLDETLKLVNEAKSYIGKEVRKEPIGNLYTVDIPDQFMPMMLDYDKPLAEQSQLIQSVALQNSKALVKKIKEINSNKLNKPVNNIYELEGADFINALGGKGKAEKILQDAGVYGIKYAETPALKTNAQGEKFMDRTGEGTSNFVIFDPSTVKILERNNRKMEGLLD
jgi:hypothetical protein